MHSTTMADSATPKPEAPGPKTEPPKPQLVSVAVTEFTFPYGVPLDENSKPEELGHWLLVLKKLFVLLEFDPRVVAFDLSGVYYLVPNVTMAAAAFRENGAAGLTRTFKVPVPNISVPAWQCLDGSGGPTFSESELLLHAFGVQTMRVAYPGPRTVIAPLPGAGARSQAGGVDTQLPPEPLPGTRLTPEAPRSTQARGCNLQLQDFFEGKPPLYIVALLSVLGGDVNYVEHAGSVWVLTTKTGGLDAYLNVCGRLKLRLV
jgi:hypothetical protein